MPKKSITFLFFVLAFSLSGLCSGIKDTIAEKVIAALQQQINTNEQLALAGKGAEAEYLVNVMLDKQLFQQCWENQLRQSVGKDRNSNPTGFELPASAIEDLKSKLAAINQRDTNYYSFVVLINYIPYDYYDDIGFVSDIGSMMSNDPSFWEKHVTAHQQQEHTRANEVAAGIKLAEISKINSCVNSIKPIRVMFVMEFVGFGRVFIKDQAVYGTDYNIDPEFGLTKSFKRTVEYIFGSATDYSIAEANKGEFAYNKLPAGKHSFTEVVLNDIRNAVDKFEKISDYLSTREFLNAHMDAHLQTVVEILVRYGHLPVALPDDPNPNSDLNVTSRFVLSFFDKLVGMDNLTASEISLEKRIKLLKVLTAYWSSAHNRLESKYQPIINKLIITLPDNSREAFFTELKKPNELCKYLNPTANNSTGSLMYCIYDNMTDNEMANYTQMMQYLTVKQRGDLQAYAESLGIKLSNIDKVGLKDKLFIWANYSTERICSAGAIDGNVLITGDCYYPTGTILLDASLLKNGQVQVNKKTITNKPNPNDGTTEPLLFDPFETIYFKCKDNVTLLNDYYNLARGGEGEADAKNADSIVSAPALALVFATDKQDRQTEKQLTKAVMTLVNVAMIAIPIAKIGQLAAMGAKELLVFSMDVGFALSAGNSLAGMYTNLHTKCPQLAQFFHYFDKVLLVSSLAYLGKEALMKSATFKSAANQNMVVMQQDFAKSIAELEAFKALPASERITEWAKLSPDEQKLVSYMLEQTELAKQVGIKMWGNNFWKTEAAELASASSSVKLIDKILNRTNLGTAAAPRYVYKDAAGEIMAEVVNGQLKVVAPKAVNNTVKEAVAIEKAQFVNAAGQAADDGLLICKQANGQVCIVQGLCFVAGTPVHTLAGQRPIENIQIGDSLVTYDAIQKKKLPGRITDLLRQTTTELVRIFVKGDSVTCTPTHPFYTKGGQWTPAAKLRRGMQVLTLAGALAMVDSVKAMNLTAPVPVYNIEVASHHTYYVGATGLLNHNTGLCRKYMETFAEKLGAQVAEVDEALNLLYSELTGTFKMEAAEAVAALEKLALTTDNAALANFLKELNTYAGGKKIAASFAGAYNKFENLGRQLAENKLFQRYLKVEKDATKAYEELFVSKGKAIELTATDYMAFITDKIRSQKIGAPFNDAALQGLTGLTPGNGFTTLTGEQFRQYGYTVKLLEGDIKKLVDDVCIFGDWGAAGIKAGERTEKTIEALFKAKGYKIADGKYGSNNGFDVVAYKGSLENPTEILIIECKQFGYKSGTAGRLVEQDGVRLNGADDFTGLQAQMSTPWITFVNGKLIIAGKSNVANMITNNPTLLKKYVCAIDRTAGTVNFIKLL